MLMLVTFIFLLGLGVVCVHGNSLFSAFFGLECMVLGVLGVNALSHMWYGFAVFVLLVCMTVVESSVVLALIVGLARVTGSDRCYVGSVDKC